ncbi:MAG: ABC-F family ATP-binding cassette domain-containing protein [Firmicutes bacterium]|nr:ABC-F family ATP-binding cassette domain-containing protein [Bacillota bacterium]
MITVEKLSYGFPEKELYEDISFTIEAGRHAALIGSNGCGKSTLADMLIDPDKYLFDGKIIRDESIRTGFASQFSIRDKSRDCTVFEFLSERFLKNQQDIAAVCEEMGSEEVMADETGEAMAKLMEDYQNLLDISEAMDADNFESNIHKQLHTAGMTDLSDIRLSQISGGEYKLLQIMKEMLTAPNLLVLDEPDVFLDFANLGSLAKMINSHKGTLLVITHNRYLLNHCFDKILHLEGCDLQEFDGSYTQYRCAQLREKLRLQAQYIEEQDEIARTEEMVDILRTRASKMVNPVIGRSVNAKQSQLDRLLARQIKAPFIEISEPDIRLPKVQKAELCDAEACMQPDDEAASQPVLTVSDYQVSFDKELLQKVDFQLMPGEKVAIVGANGTGKTTLIKDILANDDPSIHIDENIEYACISQLHGDTIDKLSSGEQNLYQIKQLADSQAELLILDEPTSHLDIFAQTAFERALAEYEGTVLMVSHDFYLVANCADYVLIVEDNTVRRMRTRKFRKMVYDKYFDQKYLETDKKKQEIEENITAAFREDDLAAVDKLCTQLEELSNE